MIIKMNALAKPVQGDFNSTTGKPFFDLKSKVAHLDFGKFIKVKF